MTNLAHIGETALLLVAAYLVGCALGYGARRILHAARGTRQASIRPPISPPPVPLPAPFPSAAARLAARVEDEPFAPVRSHSKANPSGPKPVILAAPRPGGADNLKQIKGIGPKIESSLNALGIFHLDQIASWKAVNIDWFGGQLAFKGRIRRERWVEQARKLVKAKAAA